MSSRGSFTRNNHVTTDEYKTVDTLPSGAEVLEGNKNYHSLPDYSHSPNAVYEKRNPDGTMREIRIYGPNHEPIIEIGYHPEPKLNSNDREHPVLHYHTFRSLERTGTYLMTRDIYEKYKMYLEELGYEKRKH